MSIFKETFPKFVTKQIEIREDILSSGIDPATGKHTDGSRSNDFFTYTLNKQCILRMSSGVNVIDTKLLGEIGDAENATEGRYYGPEPYTPDKTTSARNWVLEGGILNNYFDPDISPSPIRGGIGTEGAYGDSKIRGNAKDGYGIVPMPGIIDASIRTKSAYGSLREGKVKFVCHNKRQLDILEVLYMRPGYTLLFYI